MKKFKIIVNWNAIISGFIYGAIVFGVCERVNLEFGLAVVTFAIISTHGKS